MLLTYIYIYSQTWLESHCLQHQPLYNNTHGRNGFNGLCTKCPGYNNNLVITAHFSGTKGVVVNKFHCIYIYIYIDIVPDVPDTSGESKNNIGPPSGGPKTLVVWSIFKDVQDQKHIINFVWPFLDKKPENVCIRNHASL